MISVIIPTYNSPEYLDLCLQSVFEGQVNENEIIVVVDGKYELNKPILDKYPKANVLDLGNNQGLAAATNWGAYNATNEYILVVNDDNVFPRNWDVNLKPYLSKNVVVSPNQIEPNPSMFRQFRIQNLGTNSDEFSLEKFWEYADSIKLDQSDNTGSTLPFAMNKYDYLAVGGWDIMYPWGGVTDWDFFLKCEYVGYEMNRTYSTHFYHFARVSTHKTPELAAESTHKEQVCHQFFASKWDQPAKHNPKTNSKMLSF